MKDLIKTALSLFVVLLFVAFAACMAIALLLGNSARAADVAEIDNVAVLTDERGACPYNWFIVRGFDGRRGCYRVEYPSYAIVVRWSDGKVRRFTEMQFELYGEVTRP